MKYKVGDNIKTNSEDAYLSDIRNKTVKIYSCNAGGCVVIFNDRDYYLYNREFKLAIPVGEQLEFSFMECPDEEDNT